MEGVFPSSGSGIHGDAARVAARRVSLLRLLSLQSLENSAFPGLWVTRTPSGLLSLPGRRHCPGRESVKMPVILSWDFAPLQGLFSAVSAPEHARSAPPLLGFLAFWHLPGRPAIRRDCLSRYIRSQGFDPLSVFVARLPAPPVKAESASGFRTSRGFPFLRVGAAFAALSLPET